MKGGAKKTYASGRSKIEVGLRGWKETDEVREVGLAGGGPLPAEHHCTPRAAPQHQPPPVFSPRNAMAVRSGTAPPPQWRERSDGDRGPQ